jgi:hypothetical protein
MNVPQIPIHGGCIGHRLTVTKAVNNRGHEYDAHTVIFYYDDGVQRQYNGVEWKVIYVPQKPSL